MFQFFFEPSVGVFVSRLDPLLVFDVSLTVFLLSVSSSLIFYFFLLSYLIYSHFCCHRLIHFSPFVSLFFLSCLPPTRCHPSPLPLTPPSAFVSLLSATVSQRHCQTGGGVERRRAPGNPRGAFQWEGPQVKISTAAPERISGCNLQRAVNICFQL